MQNNTRDLTVGSPLKQIFIFSVPLVLGTLFQQLYSFVDSIIVGRFINSDALGAVGATYSLNFLIIGFVQGFCVGLGIPLAQRFGAKDHEDIQHYFWNGVYLCVLISIIFGSIMTLICRELLVVMQTPSALLNGAVTFIKPQFTFIWITVLYNFSASALRSFGDSTHPFYFLAFASLVNIALDFLFIYYWHWGISGAAAATLIAQLVSGLLNVYWLIVKSHVIDFRHPRLKISKHHCGRLSYIALPMGFEYSVSAIGAVIMQLAINSLGTVYVIAETAGEKIRQMFTLPMESVGMGMATYIGQNFGAKKMGRIHDGIKDGLKIQFIYCIFCLIVILALADPLSQLVIGNHPHLIALSALYLRIMSTTFILHGSLMIYRNTLQGLGYSVQAIVSGIGELVGRSITSFITMATASFIGVCLINPTAWLVALSYCIFMVYHELNKIEQERKLN